MNKIIEYTKKLIEVDSPTGYSVDSVALTKSILDNLDAKYYTDKKGNLYCEINNGFEETTMISTHLDTLGLMVKSINSDGTLNVDKLGGINPSTLNGAYCKVLTRDNKLITGIIHSKHGSVHVSSKATDKVEIENLVVSLDEIINSKDDVDSLNISTGCFIFVDPKFEVSNGFIKSRFLDDKLCCGISLALIEDIIAERITLNKNVIFAFSTYEEVGHGMATVIKDVDEFIALDMACVGEGLEGSEHKVTVCPKDSSGPYDYELTNKMIDICNKDKLNYAIDIYPFYGSDASAALRGGNDIKASLIGPGVAFSHGVERSHEHGINETYKLLCKYLTD